MYHKFEISINFKYDFLILTKHHYKKYHEKHHHIKYTVMKHNLHSGSQPFFVTSNLVE